MAKKKHLQLNRLELVLNAYFKAPWFYLAHDGLQQKAYYVKDHHYFSYAEELTKPEIEHTIRIAVQRRFPALVTPPHSSVYSELIATYFFKHIELGHEEDAIWALIIAEEEKAEYWNIWGVLDDGSILDPSQTQPYLSSFAGNKYNEIEVSIYKPETQES